MNKIPLFLLPSGIDLSTYVLVLKDSRVINALLVSILRSVLGAAVTLVVSGCAAYCLSRRDLIAGRAVRFFCMATMYLSAGLIPVYFVVSSLGLTKTFLVYIIPTAASPFFMLLIKTYIDSIPPSLEEAVLVDGGTEIDAYFRVILHVCKPINAAVLTFAAINQWNSFMDTQLYNASVQRLHTLQFFLYTITASRLTQSLEQARTAAATGQVTSETMKMAVAVITIVPIMCVYPFMQKHFASGIMLGSIKE
jgi:ABC-type glycerol-3-phosphate transport system permease component